MLPYVFILNFLVSSCIHTGVVLRVGLIADPQYENRESSGRRHYRDSLDKLDKAISCFNDCKVNMVQTFGDVINGDWDSFGDIMPIYDRLNSAIDSFQLLGNHDFAIDKNKMGMLLEVLSMPNFYYSYVKKGWRFIVLDSTDYAYYSYFLHGYRVADIDVCYAKTRGKKNHHKWNGAIGKRQQLWLKRELEVAVRLKQQVIVFAHIPLKPYSGASLWNSDEVVDILEGCKNVVAFINGHEHRGGYLFENGIHYVTLFGMVDTGESSFSVLNIYDDRLVLTGYGKQKSMILPLRREGGLSKF